MAREVTITIDVDTARGRRALRAMRGDVKDLGGGVRKTKGTVNSSFRGMGNVANVALAGAAAGAIFGVTMKLRQMASQAIDTGAAFEQQLADLQAITGIAGNELQWLGEQARQASIETGVGVQEQIEAYKLLASNIDIATAGGVRGLKAMGREVVTLSQAAGVDLSLAANVVANSINQFNLEASDSSRVVNALAAGAKEGAAEVDDLSLTMKEAGTSAAGANVSFEETIGSAEILAQNALKGSQAGTQLRNVITILQTETGKLASQGIHNVNLESEGMAATLQRLKPLLSDAGALVDVFGKENLNAARILIQNASAVGEMTNAVTGTDTAMEQAITQMNTFQGITKVLGAVIDDLEVAFFEAFGPQLKDTMRSTIDALKAVKDDMVAFFNFIVQNSGAAWQTIEAAANVVFGNMAQLIMNFVRSIPMIFLEGLDLTIEVWREFFQFVGDRITELGHTVKAIGKIMWGSLTGNLDMVKQGMAEYKGAWVETGHDLKTLAAGIGAEFNEMASEVSAGLFQDIDTSELDTAMSKYTTMKEELKAANTKTALDGAPGEPGSQLPTPAGEEDAGAGGGGAGGEGGEGDSESGIKSKELEALDAREAGQKKLTSTVDEQVKKRMTIREREMESEIAAAEKAADQRDEAERRKREAFKQTVSQQIESSAQSVKSVEDAAQHVIGSIKKQITARIAQTIAGAIAPLGPAALVLGPVIGAGISLMFNNLLPSFRGGVVGINRGIIQGPGTGTSDSILAVGPGGNIIRVSAGESIIKARSTSMAPRTLQAINRDPEAARRIEQLVVTHTTARRFAQGHVPSGGGSDVNVERFDDRRLVNAVQGLREDVKDQTERLATVERFVSVREVSSKTSDHSRRNSHVGVDG